jgi:hypothetical protein
MRLLALAASASAFVLALAVPEVARAAPPSPELLARLAAYATDFEDLRDKASFTLEGRLEKLDGDGKVDSVQEAAMRVEKSAAHRHVVVVRATEDGKDTTAEVQKKANEEEDEERQKEEKKQKGPSLRMPFHPSQQARYVFDQVEVDRASPTRVRISFVPKEPAKDTVEGSAWVDTTTARLLTAGFKLSKPGTFIDYVHITAEFAEGSPPGSALSRITFDGQGGLLFFRKHFRGETRFHDYRVSR